MCHSNALGEESEEWTCKWLIPFFVASSEEEQPIRIATKESRPHDFFKVRKPNNEFPFFTVIGVARHTVQFKE